MTTYSVRCRNSRCRHRQRTKSHPDDMQTVACPSCGETAGWRSESRAYNRRGLCHCDGPEVGQERGKNYPHRTTHPLCDHHPHGFYNQARAMGVAHDEIPEEYRPMTTETWIQVAERRPTDHSKKYLVFSNWGIRMAHLHPPEWANGEFQDAESNSDEGMYDWDETKGPFTVSHWRDLPAAP